MPVEPPASSRNLLPFFILHIDAKFLLLPAETMGSLRFADLRANAISTGAQPGGICYNLDTCMPTTVKKEDTPREAF